MALYKEAGVNPLGGCLPMLIQIPRMVYHGFKAIGNEVAYVLNCPTLPYDYENPDEHRRPWNDPEIPFIWEIKNR